MATLADYQEGWKHAALSRTDDGVLEVRLHSDDGPLWWGAGPHRELPDLFTAIGEDRANRVVLLTGTGAHFIDYDPAQAAAMAGDGVPAGRWGRILADGKRLITRYLDIDVPVIAAVNGPARVHSELAVMADIVLAADTALFQDAAHFSSGLVPGDGMHIIWPELLGLNRGRHFLLTGAELPAAEAERLGVVAEVCSQHGLLPRARAIAADLAQRDPHLLRYTRHVCTQRLKRRVQEELELGLALEGLAAAVPRG